MSRAGMRRWLRWALPVVFVATGWIASPDAVASGRGGSDYERAAELHRDRRYDEAAAEFIAAYEKGYREETSAYNAACGLALAGKTDEAFRWLDKAHDAGFDLESYLDDDSDLRSLRADPRFAALRAKIFGGRTSRHEREAAGTVKRFRNLVAEKATDPEAYDDIARELLRSGRYDEAAKGFMAAAERKTSSASSIYNAACARSLQGDKPAALTLLQQAVEAGFADPKHIDEDDDLDAIRGEPGFRQIRALARELEVPGYPSQRSDRTARSQREWQAALPRVAAAVVNHPKLGQAWFNLGFASIALGEPDQAVTSFEKSVELGYRKPTSMYNLACAHALSGHGNEALDWLERALSSGFESWSVVRTDADLDNIRHDPRFRKLLETARSHEREARND